VADTHGNPSRSIARASRAGVSVTQQGDKMHDTTTKKVTTTSAEEKEILELEENIAKQKMYLEFMSKQLEYCQLHLQSLEEYF
jgi:hypothetical protein